MLGVYSVASVAHAWKHPSLALCARMGCRSKGKAVANKDKGGAKNKKVASKTLKEKREAKKAKGASGSRGTDTSR
jgi:hypothetical protein